MRLKLFLLFLIFIVFGSQADAGSNSILKLAERFYSDSLYNLAIEQYQKYIDMPGSNERDAQALYKMALSYKNMGNTQKAAECFEKYASMYPTETNLVDAIYNAALMRRKLGDLTKASKLYYEVWSKFSGSSKGKIALFEAARCSENTYAYQDAISFYSKYFLRFSTDKRAEEAGFALIKLNIKLKRYNDAQKILEKVEKLRAKSKIFDVNYAYYKALLLQKTDKSKDALVWYKKMSECDTVIGFKDGIDAYTSYLNLLLLLRKYDVASGVFERLSKLMVSKMGTVSADFLENWADANKSSKSYGAAVKIYMRILKQEAQNADSLKIYYKLSECYVGLNNFNKAFETLNFLVRKDTTGNYAPNATLKIAELYIKNKIYLSAITYYRKYLTIPYAKNKDAVLYKIGKIYKEKYEKYGAALTEFENLARWYPSSNYYLMALYDAGVCQEKLGNYVLATKEYDFIVESGGNAKISRKAQKRSEYIKEFIIKDSDKAIETIASLFEKSPAQLSPENRLMTLAEVYGNYLRDFKKSIAIYNKLLNSSKLPDSVIVSINLRKAVLFEKLSIKYSYGNSPYSLVARDSAISIYNEIIDKYKNSINSDEAYYGILRLRKANVKEYQSFVDKFPTSRYVPEILSKIASIHLSSNKAENLELAEGAYLQILESFSSSDYLLESIIGLAKIELSKDSVQAAMKYVTMFDSISSGDNLTSVSADNLTLRGEILLKRGVYDSAVACFKQAIYQYPFAENIEELKYKLAFSEYMSERYFDAIESFNDYISSFPNGRYYSESSYYHGKLMLITGKDQNGIDELSKLLPIVEKKSRLYNMVSYELGCAMDRIGKSYEALNYLKKVDPSNGFEKVSDLYSRIGRINFDNKVFATAAEYYIKSLELTDNSRDSAEVLSRVAISFVMASDKKNFAKYTKLFRELFSDKYGMYLAEIYFNEGLHLLDVKEYEKAYNRFRYVYKTFEESDVSDDALFNMARALYYDGKVDDALTILTSFKEKYPTSNVISDVIFQTAMIYYGKNKFIRSADLFSELVYADTLDPKIVFRAANNAATAYQKGSYWLKSSLMFEYIIDNFPGKIQKSKYHLKAGFCLVQSGKYNEALQHFKSANENPDKNDKAEILYWIATCYSKLGDYDKAVEEYVKVPYLYAGSGKWGITSEFEAARIYEKQHKYSKALSLYKKIVRSDGLDGRFGKKANEKIMMISNLTDGE